MRYPDRTGFTQIPNDVYTCDMAVEAQRCAQRILDEVAEYINSRGAWSVIVFICSVATIHGLSLPLHNTFVFARPTILVKISSNDTENKLCTTVIPPRVSNPLFVGKSLSLTLFNVASLKGPLRVVGGRGEG